MQTITSGYTYIHTCMIQLVLENEKKNGKNSPFLYMFVWHVGVCRSFGKSKSNLLQGILGQNRDSLEDERKEGPGKVLPCGN